MTEFLCGDKCVPKSGKCGCGNRAFGVVAAYKIYCCNAKPCTKIQEDFLWWPNGDVYCEDGKIQSVYTHCNNSCKQTAVDGLDLQSCNDHRCYFGIYACRGTSYCKDNSDLAQCTKEINCEEQSDGGFQSCGQVPGATYQNSGCKETHAYSSTSNAYFACMNRLDKNETLFKRPIVFAKKKREAANYNVLLEYDDEFVYCGSRNISFAQLSYVTGESLNEPCQLKNGNNVTLQKLSYDLLRDFSFEKWPEMKL